MSDLTPPVVRAQMLIRAPAERVFAAFVDPAITTQFWFSQSSGRVEEGATLTWTWGMYGVSAEVDVMIVEPGQRIVILWPSPVEFRFTPVDGGTYVEITASGFEGNADEVVDQALDSMGGFTLVLSECKALLEHGIRLNGVADRAPHAHVGAAG